MNLTTYKAKREKIENEKKEYRNLCRGCRQPDFSCYCVHIEKFNPKIKFVILMHPIEMKRRIATGRMSHLCLENSEIIVGHDFSENPRVNEILTNPHFESLVLYPGARSLNLSVTSEEKKTEIFSCEKTPVVFVVDGTWTTARKMVRLSVNLKSVPRICFTPPGPSQFRVRKQPKHECYSTIEAIHHCIDLLGSSVGFDFNRRRHDVLLHVFNKMVERQLEFVRAAFDNPKSTSYRKPKSRVA